MATYTVSFDKIVKSIVIPVALEYNGRIGKFLALIDTGATTSSISEWIGTTLDLPKEQDVAYTTFAESQRICPIVKATLRLSTDLSFENEKFVLVKSDSPSYDIIIGMNFLNRGDFAISNFDGHTTFTFRTPSTEEIKFSNKMDIDKVVADLISSISEY